MTVWLLTRETSNGSSIRAFASEEKMEHECKKSMLDDLDIVLDDSERPHALEVLRDGALITSWAALADDFCVEIYYSYEEVPVE